jgi:hypothetical protein
MIPSLRKKRDQALKKRTATAAAVADEKKETLSEMTCGICMDDFNGDVESTINLCGPDCESIACPSW